jgi:membrane-bound serine protease (ClpP class)
MKRGILLLAAWLAIAPGATLGGGVVGLARVDGAISPATAGYLDRAIDVAAADGRECLVIQLDTPGGLLDSTKAIVQKFYAAQIPVVVYVAPPGANAGSAGCFITLAADVAAMAPGTSIGAAHPVAWGTFGSDQKPDETMAKKLENFATSYIEAIAVRRGRNVEWARSAVKDSASITAEKALETKVIEIVAQDLPDLLRQLDGRETHGRRLKTAGATVAEIPMRAGERTFQVLWRPEVVFFLMLLAIYGIIGELSSPGAVLPGVVGAIALVLVLYMSAVLPLNIAGLALIGLALGLFIVDVFASTHGVLTGGGIIAFLLGALMLFNRADPGFRLSLAYIVPAAVITAAFFLWIVGAGLRAQFLPARAGREAMLGRPAAALGRIDSRGGRVFVEGETWNAVSDTPVEAGQPVEIVAIEGLTLKVKPRTP